jgi:hypothetical protein
MVQMEGLHLILVTPFPPVGTLVHLRSYFDDE